jgi:hypothetical protein
LCIPDFSGEHPRSGGLEVGWYVPRQLDDYNHAFGLKDQHEPGSDDSRLPSNINATVFDLHKYIPTRQLLGL